jgi:tyrosine-protein kinase Etk/Wzc
VSFSAEKTLKRGLSEEGEDPPGKTLNMSLLGSRPPEEKLQPPVPGEGREIPIRAEELVVIRSPHSSAAEQFRRMRNSVQALNPDGASRSILMTSAAEREGKTIATLNLALAMVELPQLRLLVIDSDLKQPAVEDYLGWPRRQGVSELLSGRISLDQAIRSTSVDRLDILGAGEPTPNPSIHLERLETVLNTLKRRYDYVLLDGPAVLRASHPGLLGSISDGILLVVRLGVTPKQQVEEAFTLLENLGGNVLGTCATGAVGAR